MKPIIFNTDMVKAILDGRKTQTRRLAKFPEGMTGRLPEHPENQSEPLLFYPCGIKYCPYKIGDILYVRETWNQFYDGSFVYKADSKPNSGWRPSIHMPKSAARIFLRVTDVRAERLQKISNKDALHEGVARHGLYNEECYAGGCYNGDFESSCAKCEVPREGFSKLWNSTVKDIDRYGWDVNPWVWVIEFEVCEKLEDESCDR